MVQQSLSPSRPVCAPWPAFWPAAAIVGLLWVQWPTLTDMADQWSRDPRYSHGYLVPLFAGYLLWARRKLAPKAPLRGTWWGLGVVAGGLGLYLVGTVGFFPWFAAISLLPCLAGLALLAGGRPALRWAWPAIAFLVFMVPLPFSVANALSYPLQRMATAAGTYVLQTMGFVAFARGNVIQLGDIPLGVAEACSGLSMLLIFFALAAAVVLLCRRSPLEKAVIFASAVPIALLSNLIRIVVTAVMYKTAGSTAANVVFHDLAGWLMMPLALGFLWTELRVMDWVLVPRRSRSQPLPGLGILSGQQVPVPAGATGKTSRPKGKAQSPTGAPAPAAASAVAKEDATTKAMEAPV
jgi:exosortase